MDSQSYARPYVNTYAPKVSIPLSLNPFSPSSQRDDPAVNALGIPTSRSLSIISLPSVPVLRERRESACIVTRVAPSFLRIGSFEALNPPEELFFFGGGQQPADLEALRVLGEWVVGQVLRIEKPEGGAWGRELILDCTRRNARMVARWQAYGFMHGVINTDKYVRHYEGPGCAHL
jgi:protein adenylyltransferase